MSRAAQYAVAVVAIHLFINVMHGMAHRQLHVGLSPFGSIFVIAVVLILPLIAMALVCASPKRFGLILLSLSMLASLLFGLYHHFVVTGPDHVHSQPANAWSIAFIFTAYGLLITEAIGAYIGIHFCALAKEPMSGAAAQNARKAS